HRIQELPISPDKELTYKEMDLVLDYNGNDVDITEAVFNKLKKDINLRFAASKKYGFPLKQCVNWDGVKLGLNVLLKRYCDKFNLDIKEVEKRRTYRGKIELKDIILPEIKFKEREYSHRRYM